MKRAAIIGIVIAMLSTLSASAWDGHMGRTFGRLGAMPKGGSGGGSVVIPCTQTGLIFTTGCNLILYVVVLL
jgi:hypothetical protein